MSKGLIATARAELATLLTEALGDYAAVVRVHKEMPSALTAPCVVIGERSPLVVAETSAARCFSVNLEAVVIALPAGAPDMVKVADHLTDHLIEKLLDALPGPLSVASYSILTAGDQQPYLVARIPVTLGPYTIEKKEN